MSAAPKPRDLWNSYLDFSLPEKLEKRREEQGIEKSLVARFSDWLKPKRLLISVSIIVGLLVVLLVLLFTGNLGAFYDWLIGWSSDGKPWTHIMRDNPWIFWVFAPIVLAILFFVVPRYAYGRLWMVTAAFLVGFLGGHVFW